MLLLKPRNIQIALGMVSLITCCLLPKIALASTGYAYKEIYSFGTGKSVNGSPVSNGLAEGADGDFYGIAQFGGTGVGISFKVTPDGIYTLLHTFRDGSVVNDGVSPHASLVLASDGNFYGTTFAGGSANKGVIFKMTPAGNVTIVHSFADGSVTNDAQHPYAGLIIGSDGNFYGTTFLGGKANKGAIFKMTPSGVVTILHSFQDGSVASDGNGPDAGLTQGKDGNFYGTTLMGGSADLGTVFKVAPNGTTTILHSFQDGSDGAGPQAGLTFGSDGNLYSVTGYGGSARTGILYRITPDGVLTILHNFGDGSVAGDGNNPFSKLIAGSDGNLYGTTDGGGSAGNGTIYKLTITGTYTVARSITTSNSPSGDLLLGSDGNFYGLGDGAILASHGTVYRLSPVNLALSVPADAIAGSPLNITVSAVNDSNNLVGDYAGTVHFTSNDPNAILPADTTITNGTGSFPATLYAAAAKMIRVRDTANSNLTSTITIPVNAGPLDHLSLTVPTTAIAGIAFQPMISARDQYNNVVKSFTDTIHFTSTDPQPVFPADFVLTGGAKQLSIKLGTPGTQTITATDTNAPSFNVTSGSISVGTVISKYLITGPTTSTVGAVNTYTITAKDTVGNTVPNYTGMVHFTTTDPNATVPGDVMLVNGTGTFQVTFHTKGAQKVNANDTVNAAVKGLASTTVK